MSKFKVGDKVISVKNTHEVEEGFVGYIVDLGEADTDNFQCVVSPIKGDNTRLLEYFLENELELLKRDDITPNDFKGFKDISALDKQVSGNHYKDCGIQPIEYIHANGLNYFEGNAVKYITRHRKKNGKADIEKAIHYLELLLEMEYKEQ